MRGTAVIRTISCSSSLRWRRRKINLENCAPQPRTERCSYGCNGAIVDPCWAVRGAIDLILSRYLVPLPILILLLLRPGPVPSVGSRLKVLISVSEVDRKTFTTFPSFFFSFLYSAGVRIQDLGLEVGCPSLLRSK